MFRAVMALPHARAILDSSSDTIPEIRTQWINPGDIFSLLLLIGGDIIQEALGQLFGVRVSFCGFSISLTPVAFSFGWVAYAYASLKDIFGEGKLMPENAISSQVINCSSGYIRDNRSWILGRALRDHEKNTPVDRKDVSLRIDVFEGVAGNQSDKDILWWVSWAAIFLQQVIAMIPWMLYGDWSTLFVTLCGTIGALGTGMLPQWGHEKWGSRLLDPAAKKVKITALTRGNGHTHVMLFVNKGVGWDVEAMATASGEARRETRHIAAVLTVWWTLLLITCAGLRDHTWFLIGVGGVGMLQNIIVAGKSRPMGSFNLHYTPGPTIIGKRKPKDEIHEPEDSEPEDHPNPLNDIGGVMGPLMEVEKQFPGVGASLVGVFFPPSLDYNKGMFRFKRERKFWKYAFQTLAARKKAKEE